MSMNRRSLLGRALPAVLVPAIVRQEKGEWQWRTAKGEWILLSKIEDRHLLNIERMLRGDGRQEYDLPGKEEAHVIIIGEVARRKLRTKPALFAVRQPFDESGDFGFVDGDGWPDIGMED